MTCVVAASVVLKWVLSSPATERDTQQALSLLGSIREGRTTVLQPPHWLAEVAAATTRLVPRRAEAVIGLMYAMEFPVSNSPEIYGRACELAVSSGAHVFDTLYHAGPSVTRPRCWSPRTSATIVGRPRGAAWYGFRTFGSSRPA